MKTWLTAQEAADWLTSNQSDGLPPLSRSDVMILVARKELPLCFADRGNLTVCKEGEDPFKCLPEHAVTVRYAGFLETLTPPTDLGASDFVADLVKPRELHKKTLVTLLPEIDADRPSTKYLQKARIQEIDVVLPFTESLQKAGIQNPWFARTLSAFQDFGDGEWKHRRHAPVPMSEARFHIDDLKKLVPPVCATETSDAAEPETNAGKRNWEIAGTWEHGARARGEKWMLAEEKKTSKNPSVEKIAKFLEGDMSTAGRELHGKRGEFLDWQTIKREALTGITGRKAGRNAGRK